MMARPAGIAIGAAGKTTSKREGALFASWSAFRAASERSLGGDTRPFYAPPSRAAPLPLVMHSHACLRSFRSVSSHATSHRLAHSVHNGCQQCRWVGTQDHGMRRRRAPHRWLLWCILMRAFARFAPSRRMPPLILPLSRHRCRSKAAERALSHDLAMPFARWSPAGHLVVVTCHLMLGWRQM